MQNSQYVDTKIGTIGDMTDTSLHGGGKTYPGAVYPSGMVQFSPDTLEGGDNGSGYSYHHTTIDGFSINHLSGIGWYGDLGNFQVMPTIGPLNLLSGTYQDALSTRKDRGYESDFNHETEITKAGYYAVTLDTYKIRAETTATLHTGVIRMTYPSAERRRVQINLARRIAGRSSEQELSIVNPYTLEGCIHCPSTHGGFGRGGGNVNYNLYFHAEFSEPWESFGVWNCNSPMDIENCMKSEYSGEELWFYGEFPPSDNPIVMQIAVSYINLDGARDNFEKEKCNGDFDAVRVAATEAWDNALSVVQVDDDRSCGDMRTIFYTTMYHALLDPRVFSDVNGNYLSADNTIKKTKAFQKRTVFSGWDVFRSEFPLLTLIQPETVNDMINSLIDIAESENVSFPRWELMGHDTGCMLGDPGIICIVDAYRKGIHSFDANKAYEICLATANDPDSKRTKGIEYKKYGYVPNDISATLENAFADHCIAVFAELMGDKKNAEHFRQMSKNWRNIYSEEVGWMRCKDENGNWLDWIDEYDERGCTESNIFQQHWYVPHDPQGLISLMGKKRFLEELERLMSDADLSAMWNTAYNHPNEPCHHLVHMFIDAGQAHRTQYWVRRIQEESYNITEFGFCGNEDVGQMSAWFTMTALGFHMLAPGSGIFHVNTPLFKQTEIKLSKKYHNRSISDTLIIETDADPAENIYIRGIDVNGKPINRAWLNWNELSDGGVITYHLSKEPDDSWISILPPSNSI